MDNTRVMQPESLDSDVALDNSLRPKKLRDFVGQRLVKETLQLALDAAVKRGEPIEAKLPLATL